MEIELCQKQPIINFKGTVSLKEAEAIVKKLTSKSMDWDVYANPEIETLRDFFRNIIRNN